MSRRTFREKLRNGEVGQLDWFIGGNNRSFISS